LINWSYRQQWFRTTRWILEHLLLLVTRTIFLLLLFRTLSCLRGGSKKCHEGPSVRFYHATSSLAGNTRWWAWRARRGQAWNGTRGLRGRVHSKIQTQKPRVSVRVQVKLSEPYNHVPTPDGLLSPEVWSITLCSGYMWNKTLK